MDQYVILPLIKAGRRSLGEFGCSHRPKELSCLLWGKTSAAWKIRAGRGIFGVLFPSSSWWESRPCVVAVVPEMWIAAGSERKIHLERTMQSKNDNAKLYNSLKAGKFRQYKQLVRHYSPDLLKLYMCTNFQTNSYKYASKQGLWWITFFKWAQFHKFFLCICLDSNFASAGGKQNYTIY